MSFRFLNPLNWRKSFLISILLLLLVLWFGFIDTYSIRARVQLSNEKKELVTETEHLQNETGVLKEKMEAFRENPGLLEKLAREEYGMRMPGETVYRIRENQTHD